MENNPDSGGGGGGGSDGLDSSEYVEDGSVAWGRVGGAMAGAVLTLVGYALAKWIALWSGGATAVMDGFGSFMASLVALPFAGATDVVSTAWGSFAAFLPTLGVAAFPAAVLATVGVFLILYWGVNRVVWGV